MKTRHVSATATATAMVAAAATSVLGVALSAGPAAAAAPAAPVAHRVARGIDHAVFVQTNNPQHNTIEAFHRADNGALTRAGSYPTGGRGGALVGGPTDPLASQGSLVYDAAHRELLAVNAGSNTLTVFGVRGDALQRLQILSTSGTFPVSITTHGRFAYVVNAGRGGSISGYHWNAGRLVPTTHSTRPLGLGTSAVPNFLRTPAQIGFTSDGRHLIVPTKTHQTIDVFGVDGLGRAGAPVKNAAPLGVPFSFVFDSAGRLILNSAAGFESSYVVNPDNTLTTVDAGIANKQLATCWIVGIGSTYYAVNTASNTITGFTRTPGSCRCWRRPGSPPRPPRVPSTSPRAPAAGTCTSRTARRGRSRNTGRTPTAPSRSSARWAACRSSTATRTAWKVSSPAESVRIRVIMAAGPGIGEGNQVRSGSAVGSEHGFDAGSDDAGSAGAGSADATVVRALRAGDMAAFTAFAELLNPQLLRAARTWVDSTAAAEDLVQDTWLVVIERLDRFEGRAQLRTWVFGILVNLGRRRAVRERRSIPFSAAWADDRAPAVPPERFHRAGERAGTWSSPPQRFDDGPDDFVDRSELRSVLDRAIAGLPRRQREVVTTRDVLGWTPEQVCEVLHLTDGNHRILLHRGRSRLRAALESYRLTTEGEA